jgi:hypothetical protein
METYIRNEETITGQLDSDLVMVDIEKGSYFSLNAVGTRIWELLENPLTVDELCHTLTEEFEVDDDQCHMEVVEYLAEMRKHDLIRKV